MLYMGILAVLLHILEAAAHLVGLSSINPRIGGLILGSSWPHVVVSLGKTLKFHSGALIYVHLSNDSFPMGSIKEVKIVPDLTMASS